VGRSLYTVTLPITISSNLSSYYFWVDLIIIITNSLRLDSVNPSGTFKKLSIGLSLVMLLTLDLTLSIAGYNGRLKGEASKIPGTVISALLGVIAIVNFYVSWKVVDIMRMIIKEEGLIGNDRAADETGAQDTRGVSVPLSSMLTGTLTANMVRTPNLLASKSNKVSPDGDTAAVSRGNAVGDGYSKKFKIVVKLRRSFWSLMSSGVLMVTFIAFSLMVSQNRQYLNVTLFAILYQGSMLGEQLIALSNVQLLKIAMRPVEDDGVGYRCC
jgi:hypothetical protein